MKRSRHQRLSWSLGLLVLSLENRSAAFQIVQTQGTWRHRKAQRIRPRYPSDIPHRLLSQPPIHQVLPIRNQDQEDPSQPSIQPTFVASYQTALCIIPPDEAWDTLQRARHFARDESYHRWPPAIRLFHPFCPREQLADVALDTVAQVIDKHNIQPFPVTLNRWTVMPIPENLKMAQQVKLQQEQDSDVPTTTVKYTDEHDRRMQNDPEYKAIQELIASEEQRGLERKKQRELRKKQKAIIKEMEMRANNNTLLADEDDDVLERTLAALLAPPVMEEEEEEPEPAEPLPTSQEDDLFNGPAIIALEPDEQSSRKLQQLRELLRQELFGHYPSVDDDAGSDAMEDVFLQEDDDPLTSISFRPLIPMGTFPTIDEALQTAKRLKGLWDPLSFEVTDLHFVSQIPKQNSVEVTNRQQRSNSKNSNHRNSKQYITEAPGIAFGCDAMVMLLGEELEQDEQANELLANHVWERGTPGGFFAGSAGITTAEEQDQGQEQQADDASHDSNSRRKEDWPKSYKRKLDAKEGNWDELLDWLDGEEEDEEKDVMGTTIVIGRTHMFSGERRIYVGMPASRTSEDQIMSSFALGSGTFSADAYAALLEDSELDLP